MIRTDDDAPVTAPMQTRRLLPDLALVDPAPTAGTVDGFQRALDLEQQAASAALSGAPRAAREKLIPLLADLYAQLRTPVFPKGAYRGMVESLVAALAGQHTAVHLHAVLASPTAEAEIGHFIDCAAVFKTYEFAVRTTFLMVQWDNLIESELLDGPSRARAFERDVRAAESIARSAGLALTLLPLAVDIDPRSGEILSPPDFREWSRRVLGAARDSRGADPALVRDVAWSRAFYARQESLSRLGPKQALVDLAIRRAVGQRVSTSPSAADGSEVCIAITSELHKRFLPCYAPSIPLLNIDARGQRAKQRKLA